MKKLILYFMVVLGCSEWVAAQTFPTIWDTIFVANFESGSMNEPIDLPEGFPTGNDEGWVNFSEFGHPQYCLSGELTRGWYPLLDFTDPTQTNENLAFTSCSFTDPNNPISFNCPLPTHNWLILPPIKIEGDLAVLHWKSASYYNPYWLDGYKVLVSTSSNFPEDFTDTLFVAAEMIDAIHLGFFGELDPKYYRYSPGYIHANRYTLTQYFIPHFDPDGYPMWLGQFEPHAADLSKYKGKRIYIAFLHDSNCDDHLQIDDIVVVDDKTIGFSDIERLGRWQVQPNPAKQGTSARLILQCLQPLDVQFLVFDLAGRMLQSQNFGQVPVGSSQFNIDLLGMPAGMYFTVLRTEMGDFSQKMFIR